MPATCLNVTLHYDCNHNVDNDDDDDEVYGLMPKL